MKGLPKNHAQTQTEPPEAQTLQKGHPPPRLEDQMRGKKDKKFSILLSLGRDMEQSPIQVFLHIGISNTAIYLERKLSRTIPDNTEEQSLV